MNETPEQIADRLMAPATEYALWTNNQVRALLIKALKEAPAEPPPRPAPTSEPK